MKIVHLTSVHRATDPRIFERECISLAGAGHEVVLVCRHDRPETAGGVEIKPFRVPSNRLGRMTLGLVRCYKAARAVNADVYHLHDPELLLLAPFLKRRAKLVFDAHEDLPAQLLSKLWIPRLLRRPLSIVVRGLLPLLLRFSDAVITATPAIADTLGRPATVVQNYPRLKDAPRDRFSERERSVAYVGALNQARGADQLIDALGRLPEDSPVTLRFAGFFEPPELEARLSRRPGWPRVVAAGWLDRSGVDALLSRCRAGVVTLLPTPNFVTSQPIKLFEYMAAGLPVIASEFPLWREIVEGDRCGILVDPGDPSAIAEAISFLTSDDPEPEEMGRRGRAAVERTYNWQTQEKALLALYEAL